MNGSEVRNRVSVLGIDIGGTKVALRSEGGRAEHEDVVRWSAGVELDDDLELLRSAVIDAVRTAGRPTSVGIALPATVDRSGRVTSWPNRPTWVGLDWAGFLVEAFPDSVVRTGDDGDLAALAEAEHAECENAVYFGVGTGVGGGVVLGGRPVPGPGRGSCELGHLVIAADGGPRCACGRIGCLQAFASGPAMLRAAGDVRGRPVQFDELRSAWAEGQDWARRAVRSGAGALAAAAVGVAELLHPDVVLIGGGFADGLPGFADMVSEHVGHAARTGHAPPLVAAAALGSASSLQGAVRLAWQHA